MQKLLIATFNKGKLEDYKSFLKDLPVKLVTLSNVGISEEFDEIFETFEENAKGKAEYYHQLSNLPTLADDSGIEIPFYDMKPGVYTKNWAEVEVGDVDHHQFRIDKIKAIPFDQRHAQLRAVLALCIDGKTHLAEGVIKGILTDKVYENSSTQGYPWDRVFIIPELNKYYEELSQEENYKYNHRRLALEKLRQFLTLAKKDRFD
jgi:XTP/dITP diphosphohydrolase